MTEHANRADNRVLVHFLSLLRWIVCVSYLDQSSLVWSPQRELSEILKLQISHIEMKRSAVPTVLHSRIVTLQQNHLSFVNNWNLFLLFVTEY